MLRWFEHSDAVSSISFSKNGQTLATASNDGRITLWCTNLWQARVHLEGHSCAVHSIAFNSISTLLASASDDTTIKIWRTADGHNEFTLVGHLYPVYSVSFSPNDQSLASGGFDKAVKIWTMWNTPEEQQTLLDHVDSVYAVAYNFDGTLLASGSRDKTINIWRSQDGFCLRKLMSIYTYFRCVAFSPDGKLLASGGGDASLKIWPVHYLSTSTPTPHPSDSTELPVETESDMPTHYQCTDPVSLGGHTDTIMSVAWSPDGATIASGSGDKTVRLWTLQPARAPPQPKQFTSAIVSPAASATPTAARTLPNPHGRMPLFPPFLARVTTSRASVAGGVSAPAGGFVWRQLRVMRHGAPVLAVGFAPGGNALAAGDDGGAAAVWDLIGAERRLAVAMSRHPRLGAASPLGALEAGVVVIIAGLLPALAVDDSEEDV